MKRKSERCDHCKKWVSGRHQTDIYTLEGIVSPDVYFSFAICGKCISKNHSREYWDAWVNRQAEVK
jgi:hypothetical protein